MHFLVRVSWSGSPLTGDSALCPRPTRKPRGQRPRGDPRPAWGSGMLPRGAAAGLGLDGRITVSGGRGPVWAGRCGRGLCSGASAQPACSWVQPLPGPAPGSQLGSQPHPVVAAGPGKGWRPVGVTPQNCTGAGQARPPGVPPPESRWRADSGFSYSAWGEWGSVSVGGPSAPSCRSPASSLLLPARAPPAGGNTPPPRSLP